MKTFSLNSALREHQWLLVSRLCQRGYSIREAMDILRKTYPKDKTVIKLAEGLDQGIRFEDLLGNSTFEKRLSFYVTYLPVGQAISVVNRQLEKERKIRGSLTSKLGYQAVLAMAAIAIMFLFSGTVLPNMMLSLDMTEGKAAQLMEMFKVLGIFRNVFAVLLVLTLAGIVTVRLTNSERYIWMFLHQKNMDQLIKAIVTYRFSVKLDSLLEAGLTFIDAVEILRYQNDDQLVKLLAFHFDETLLKGTPFENSLNMNYFDNEFYSLCLWGLRSDDFRRSLQDYMTMMEVKGERVVKTSLSLIQALSYFFVALVIILAYQVLLLPLELLEQI